MIIRTEIHEYLVDSLQSSTRLTAQEPDDNEQ
jgi:hypothetical protein